MQVPNMKQKSVDVHDFSMIPKAEIPRAGFPISHNVKMPFNFSDLVPLFMEEVLPGDHWNVKVTAIFRTAVPIVPIMDNWHCEYFCFFVPNRLVWNNWQKFMGEQTNPGDSISYTIPTTSVDAGAVTTGSLIDLMGIPGQLLTVAAVSINALPFRGYNLIYNTWFRDENLINSVSVPLTDGPDSFGLYTLLQRGKRHDYFTSCLPWPQKGNTAVTLPLGTTAPIKSSGGAIAFSNVAGTRSEQLNLTSGSANPTWTSAGVFATSGATFGPAGGTVTWGNVDLSAATAATINQLRQSFQIQRLLERDARGGTRYTEIVRAHFGVVSPDARLQRPEYIGGGKMRIETSAIPQTSATGLTGSTTPVGTLAATGHGQGTAGFSYAATEHGYIFLIASARADLTYQQGIAKKFKRSTRYDFYFPAFAMLGEQAVLNSEIFATGAAADNNVFGYQERWAEYRQFPSRIAGLYRSNAAGTIDYWHSAEKFAALPTLNGTFITDQAKTVVQRNFAGGAATLNQQILADVLLTGQVVRALPHYSVPGMIDHF